MFGQRFYNQTTRRYVAVFGTLFNDIQIGRSNNAGVEQQRVTVPINYAPMQKLLARLEQDPNLDQPAITLPRMSFEMTGMQYNPTRKLPSSTRQTKSISANDSALTTLFTPAPYDLEFQLNIMTKYTEDGTKILEQILPYFKPDVTVSVKMIDTMDFYVDIPVVLNSVSAEDTYEGDFTERRVISYALEFTMKLYFFGPVYTGDVIKSVVERDYINQTSGTFTTTQIDGAGLVKEVKHYEPAFAEIVSADTLGTSNTYTFASAINSKISVGDEIFGFRTAVGNVVVATISEDRRTITANEPNAISKGDTLKFVGSVQPNDTFVVAENVTFYDDGTISTFADDKVTDAS